MPTEIIAPAREHYRTFHLTGVAADNEIDASLRPAILNQFTDLPRLATFYPISVTGGLHAEYHADSLVVLHAAALTEARRAGRTRFWEDVRRTASRLREILELDRSHAPGAVSAETVTASLGSRVGAFFNPGLLATALQRPANPLKCMELQRRSRCEFTLAMLEKSLHDAASDPDAITFHACDADNFAAALELCDARLDALTHLLRAVRVARLEIDAAYDPAVHAEMLARFDWESATVEELLAIPPIVIFETADRLAQASLTSFGRLLRSGRPVQILITRPSLQPDDLSGFSPDLGYLSFAHRESFVLQSSMAEPAHLLPGLAAMAKSQRPAVAVVSVPDGPETWPSDSLLVLSRTIPLYAYDPDAGLHWAERFRLFVPPASELLAAHAAAVADNLRRHFRVIPASAWNSDQMEFSEYLAAYKTRPPLAIPYIWVDGPNNTQDRALLTRDLANFAVDRRRAWNLFEELSGIGKPQPAPNDTARQEGAKEALQQVIAMLTSV